MGFVSEKCQITGTRWEISDRADTFMKILLKCLTASIASNKHKPEKPRSPEINYEFLRQERIKRLTQTEVG